MNLSAEDRAIVREEEALLLRARLALRKFADASQTRRAGDLRSVDALRALRDEAATAAADDLPPLLLELSVRQELVRRARAEPLPDPDAPYLAHLAVREGSATKDYLLGRASFLDVPAGVRIVDWRVAPVAQIFYRYREGDAYEEPFPGRVAEGSVVARRIVVIADGILTQVVGDGLVLTRGADGQWTREDRSALALQPGGAGTAARAGSLGLGRERTGAADVTALLDAEQFAAVCAPPEQPLVVLGSAGSGKTTVALHRLARIAAQEPARYPLSRMRVVVPEEGLARLARRLLEPLGAPARSVEVQTLDAWSLELARHVFGAALPRICDDPPALVTSVKRHPALYDALRARFASLSPAGTTLPRLRRRLADALTDRAFLGGVVAAAGGSISRAAIEETVRHTMMQLGDTMKRQLASITDPEMKRAVDERPIEDGTPGELAGTLDAEDLPILLFLKAWRAGIEAPSVAHLVLDEAEDFSLFELFVLGKLFDARAPASVTLAGDEAQQTSSSFAGWSRSLATLVDGSADAREEEICRLAISYRCPRPVAELAQRILGLLAAKSPALASREGAPVGFFRFPDEGQAHLFVAGALQDLALREPRASVAVLARDKDAARRFHALVREVPDARLVLRGEFSFDAGLDVTDVDSAKGLEFDYVVVPDATECAYPMSDESRRRLHVAATRASHQLWLVAGGPPSPILGELASPAS